MCVILLRHLQLLGMLMHSMGIDHIRGSFFSVFPGVIVGMLSRPFSIAQMDCLDQVENHKGITTEEHLRPDIRMFLYGAFMFPAGLCLMWLFHWLRECRLSLRKRILFHSLSETSAIEQASRLAQRMEIGTISVHEWYDLPRQCIAWTLIALPVALQSSSLLLACSVSHGSDLVISEMNSDVICTLPVYVALYTKVLGFLIVVTLPPVVIFYHVLSRAAVNEYQRTISGRRVLGLLIIGWRDQLYHFEVLYFVRTIVVAIIPVFARGRETVFVAQFSTILLIAIIARSLLPRLNNDRRSLHSLEHHSYLLLLSTLLLGILFEVTNPVRSATTPDALIKEDMVPAFLKDHKNDWANVCALMHVGFVLYVVFSMLWNKVIIRRHIRQESFGNISGCTWMLLSFARCVSGLNSIKFVNKEQVNDSTGNQGGGAYIDATNLRERERMLLMNAFRMVIQVCMDSKQKFNMAFIMGAVQEVFVRADCTRQAVKNDYEIQAFLKGKEISRITDGDGVQGHEGQVTVDELHAGFVDVEHDIINHSPDLHVINSCNSDQTQPTHERIVEMHEDKQDRVADTSVERERVAIEMALAQELERQKLVAMHHVVRYGISNGADGVGQVVTSEVISILDQLFQDDVAMLNHHEQDSLSQSKRHALKKKLSDAMTEIARLKELLHKTEIAGARDALSNQKNNNSSSGIVRLLDQARPPIASDLRTLHGEWKVQRNLYLAPEEPLAPYSPRARGLSPLDPHVAQSHQRLHDQTSTSWLSDRLGRGFGMQAEAPASTLPTEVAAAPRAKAAAMPAATAIDASIAQDAVVLCFDTLPGVKVHPGVFKAMLLGGLRACGVPETSVVQFTVVLQEDLSDGGSTSKGRLAAHVQAAPPHISILRGVDTSRLKVMGYALQCVEDAKLLPCSAIAAAAPSTAAAAAVSLLRPPQIHPL